MNNERGDFKWKDDEIVWIPDEKGGFILHPVLGPMQYNSPFVDVIIGIDLAEEITKSIKEYLRNLP